MSSLFLLNSTTINNASISDVVSSVDVGLALPVPASITYPPLLINTPGKVRFFAKNNSNIDMRGFAFSLAKRNKDTDVTGTELTIKASVYGYYDNNVPPVAASIPARLDSWAVTTTPPVVGYERTFKFDSLPWGKRNVFQTYAYTPICFFNNTSIPTWWGANPPSTTATTPLTSLARFDISTNWSATVDKIDIPGIPTIDDFSGRFNKLIYPTAWEIGAPSSGPLNLGMQYDSTLRTHVLTVTAANTSTVSLVSRQNSYTISHRPPFNTAASADASTTTLIRYDEPYSCSFWVYLSSKVAAGTSNLIACIGDPNRFSASLFTPASPLPLSYNVFARTYDVKVSHYVVAGVGGAPNTHELEFAGRPLMTVNRFSFTKRLTNLTPDKWHYVQFGVELNPSFYNQYFPNDIPLPPLQFITPTPTVTKSLPVTPTPTRANFTTPTVTRTPTTTLSQNTLFDTYWAIATEIDNAKTTGPVLLGTAGCTSAPKQNIYMMSFSPGGNGGTGSKIAGFRVDTSFRDISTASHTFDASYPYENIINDITTNTLLAVGPCHYLPEFRVITTPPDEVTIDVGDDLLITSIITDDEQIVEPELTVDTEGEASSLLYNKAHPWRKNLPLLGTKYNSTTWKADYIIVNDKPPGTTSRSLFIDKDPRTTTTTVKRRAASILIPIADGHNPLDYDRDTSITYEYFVKMLPPGTLPGTTGTFINGDTYYLLHGPLISFIAVINWPANTVRFEFRHPTFVSDNTVAVGSALNATYSGADTMNQWLYIHLSKQIDDADVPNKFKLIIYKIDSTLGSLTPLTPTLLGAGTTAHPVDSNISVAPLEAGTCDYSIPTNKYKYVCIGDRMDVNNTFGFYGYINGIRISKDYIAPITEVADFVQTGTTSFLLGKTFSFNKLTVGYNCAVRYDSTSPYPISMGISSSIELLSGSTFTLSLQEEFGQKRYLIINDSAINVRSGGMFSSFVSGTAYDNLRRHRSIKPGFVKANVVSISSINFESTIYTTPITSNKSYFSIPSQQDERDTWKLGDRIAITPYIQGIYPTGTILSGEDVSGLVTDATKNRYKQLYTGVIKSIGELGARGCADSGGDVFKAYEVIPSHSRKIIGAPPTGDALYTAYTPVLGYDDEQGETANFHGNAYVPVEHVPDNIWNLSSPLFVGGQEILQHEIAWVPTLEGDRNSNIFLYDNANLDIRDTTLEFLGKDFTTTGVPLSATAGISIYKSEDAPIARMFNAIDITFNTSRLESSKATTLVNLDRSPTNCGVKMITYVGGTTLTPTPLFSLSRSTDSYLPAKISEGGKVQDYTYYKSLKLLQNEYIQYLGITSTGTEAAHPVLQNVSTTNNIVMRTWVKLTQAGSWPFSDVMPPNSTGPVLATDIAVASGTGLVSDVQCLLSTYSIVSSAGKGFFIGLSKKGIVYLANSKGNGYFSTGTDLPVNQWLLVKFCKTANRVLASIETPVYDSNGIITSMTSLLSVDDQTGTSLASLPIVTHATTAVTTGSSVHFGVNGPKLRGYVDSMQVGVTLTAQEAIDLFNWRPTIDPWNIKYRGPLDILEGNVVDLFENLTIKDSVFIGNYLDYNMSPSNPAVKATGHIITPNTSSTSQQCMFNYFGSPDIPVGNAEITNNVIFNTSRGLKFDREVMSRLYNFKYTGNTTLFMNSSPLYFTNICLALGVPSLNDNTFIGGKVLGTANAAAASATNINIGVVHIDNYYLPISGCIVYGYEIGAASTAAIMRYSPNIDTSVGNITCVDIDYKPETLGAPGQLYANPVISVFDFNVSNVDPYIIENISLVHVDSGLIL